MDLSEKERGDTGRKIILEPAYRGAFLFTTLSGEDTTTASFIRVFYKESKQWGQQRKILLSKAVKQNASYSKHGGTPLARMVDR